MSPSRLADPNIIIDNQDKWEHYKTLAQANLIFTPLEIKAFYVIGLIDDICQSVQCLLKCKDAWPEKYLPAYSLFASSVDLLGRCLTANQTTRGGENLRVGFWYIFYPTLSPPPQRLDPSLYSVDLITSQGNTYNVEDLRSLRNFTSHGQATVNTLPSVDNKLLSHFPKALGNAMETYWSALQDDRQYCSRLGGALIEPYSNRVAPLLKTLKYFSSGLPVGDLFFRLEWDVN